ncbi:MAG: EamA family transporter [Nakamurella sp.]
MRPRDTALATLVAVIWGINFLAVDRGLQDLPPFAFVAVRFVFVALPAVFFVPRPRIGFWRVVAIGATISAGQFGLLFLGMHLGAPTGLAPIVLQAQVLFTVVLSALFLRERPTGGQLVGVLIGAAGLAASRSDGQPSRRCCRC